jgi:AcrR family transcriptional regulator
VPTRQDKRRRTRLALVRAAQDLFDRKGYDGATVAEIAAAADISTRSFFSHFASKEELLFPDAEARVHAAVDAIAARGPDDGPADVLLRALRAVNEDPEGEPDSLAALRVRLIRTVPAVRGRALQLQLDAVREIGRHLAAAYPDRLDEVSAAALTGAFVGAVAGAVQAVTDAGDPGDPAAVQAAVRRATAVALSPWLGEGS